MSKRTKEFEKIVDKKKLYSLKEAIEILKKSPKVKFDETVEIAIKLDIDPKETSQAIRGTVALPHGTGKKVKIAVFAKGESEKNAKEAGADFVGAEDLVTKVQGGWCDFDVAISTPEMMKEMAKLGKILGPRGLMPNPKTGTVTDNVAKAIADVKKGKIEFRMDKQANILAPVGKISFSNDALFENAASLIEAIYLARPSTAKGHFVKSIALSSTMGPGIKLELSNWGKSNG